MRINIVAILRMFSFFMIFTNPSLLLADGDCYDVFSGSRKTIPNYLAMYDFDEDRYNFFASLYPPMKSVIPIQGVFAQQRSSLHLFEWMSFLGNTNLRSDHSRLGRARLEIVRQIESFLYDRLMQGGMVFFDNIELNQKELSKIYTNMYQTFGIDVKTEFSTFFYKVDEILSSEKIKNINDGSHQFIMTLPANDPWVIKFFSGISLREEFKEQIEELSNLIFDPETYKKLDEKINNSKDTDSDSVNLEESFSKIDLKEQIQIVLEQLILKYAFKLYTPVFINDGWMTKQINGGCSAVIASSNTLITAAHCIDIREIVKGESMRIVINHKGKDISSVAYYIHPQQFHYAYLNTEGVNEDTLYKAEILDPKKVTDLHDIAIIRFPDGTFDGEYQSQVGPSSSLDSGIFVGTQASPHIRRIISMSTKSKTDEPILNEYYTSVNRTIPGDSGGPLFGEDNKVIGILYGGEHDGRSSRFSLIRENEDFLRWVISVDPKVKINGLN